MTMSITTTLSSVTIPYFTALLLRTLLNSIHCQCFCSCSSSICHNYRLRECDEWFSWWISMAWRCRLKKLPNPKLVFKDSVNVHVILGKHTSVKVTDTRSHPIRIPLEPNCLPTFALKEMSLINAFAFFFFFYNISLYYWSNTIWQFHSQTFIHF